MDKIAFLNQHLKNDRAYREQIPAVLFKYRPFDVFTFDMLEQAYVHMGPAEYLDDPSECMATLDWVHLYMLDREGLERECVYEILNLIRDGMAEEPFRRLREQIGAIAERPGAPEPEEVRAVLEQFRADLPEGEDPLRLTGWICEISEKLDDPLVQAQMEHLVIRALQARKNMGICSLSECGDLSDMWEKYADGGRGYRIAYDTGQYRRRDVLFPVIYDDDRDTNIVTRIMDSFIGQMICGLSGREVDADISHYFRLFITKNEKWAYQKEWRLIVESKFRIEAPAVLGILLGPRVSPENEERMRDFGWKAGFPVEKKAPEA